MQRSFNVYAKRTHTYVHIYIIETEHFSVQPDVIL